MNQPAAEERKQHATVGQVRWWRSFIVRFVALYVGSGSRAPRRKRFE